MKVSVKLPEDIVVEVNKLAGGKNRTGSMLIAWRAYIVHQNLLMAIQNVQQNPVLFHRGFSAQNTCKLNRTAETLSGLAIND